MTIRPIRIYGDPILREATREVVTIDERIESLVEDLLETTDMDGRAGVAANQIGSTWRVFAWHADGKTGYLINPVIEEVSGECREIDEGCLSVPSLWFPTPRYEYCRASGIDLDGNRVELAGEGLMAQILQHEIDHLDGTVYIERLEKPTHREAMRQIRSAEWFMA